MPRSIRDKNSLQCSVNVRKDDQIVAALQDSQTRYDVHKTAMAADIKLFRGIGANNLQGEIGGDVLGTGLQISKSNLHFSERN